MNQAQAADRLVIRAWPKMLFFVPTAVVALIMGLATRFIPSYQNVWGMMFMVVFILNLLLLTFEFPRGTSLTMTFAIAALLLFLYLISEWIPLLSWITSFFSHRQLSASPEFYYFITVAYLCLAFGMYCTTRFDYWELEANEVVHHSGLLGDVERFSTAGMKFNKEITDIFEYMLLGAGRLVMLIPASPRPIVLDNVIGINKISELADRVLEAHVVRVESSESVQQKTAGQIQRVEADHP